MKNVKAVLMLVGPMIGAGMAWADEPRLADDRVAAWVEKRVADWQPTADDRRFDEIGWVPGIRDALRLGKEHNRPVFLFTHDGHMAVGRC
jgi:hypothetical protein